MTDWPMARLGDLCVKIGSGATPRGGKEFYKSSGIPLIRSQNVFNNEFSRNGLAFIDEAQAADLEHVTVQTNDVLLNITGDSVARSCRAPSTVVPARVNQHVAIVRPRPGVMDARYLGYVMTAPEMQAQLLVLASAGATRNALTKKMIEDLAVPLPPIEIQRRIGFLLATLDERKDSLRRTSRVIESIARDLFRSWFVDFDPVRAKMEGRPTGLPDDVAALFPERMADSPAGPIPEEWHARPLKDACRLVMGASPPSEFYNQVGEGLPFHQGVTNFGVRFPTHETFTTVTDRTADVGDVLCSVRAPVGRINVADRQLVVGRGLSAIRHNSGAQSFLLYHLFHFFREEDSIGDGTIFNAVTKKDMEDILILTPPPDLVAAFERIANSLDARIHQNEQESRTLVALRDTLLPKLLSGELRVPVEAAT